MLKHLLFASMLALPAHAQERLVFTAPEGFGAPLESTLDGVTVESYLPLGQNLSDWTQLVTKTVSPDAVGIPAGRALELMLESLSATCPGAAAQQGPVGLQNGYDTAVMVTQCPRSALGDDVPETAVIKVLSGFEALYTLRYAWRETASAEQVQSHVLWTRTQILCDPSGVQTPCPPE